MISEALGRTVNVEFPAINRWISMRDASAILFLVHEVDGATVITLSFANDAAGTGATTPAVIDHYYGKSFDVAAGVWHRNNIAATNTFIKPDGTDDLVAIEVLETMCPTVNGVKQSWVRVNGDGASTVTAILHDLAYQRAPQNLRSVTA